jgi:hypothetical protein
LRSCTVSPIRSTRLIFCLISAAAPTDVGKTSDQRLFSRRRSLTTACGILAPDTRIALSRLDKAQTRILPLDKVLDKVCLSVKAVY